MKSEPVWSWTCDRCGRVHDQPYNSRHPEGWAALTVTVDNPGLGEVLFDLCPTCRVDFAVFLERGGLGRST